MRLTVLMAGMIWVATAGCLTSGQPYVPTTRYSIRPEIAVEKAPRIEKSLGIRTLDLAPSLRTRVAFREGGYVLDYYPNAEWAESPRDAVTRALLDALLATDHFADVGDARDIRGDLVLTGELRAFEEWRTEEGRVAHVEVRLEVRTSLDARLVWANTVWAKAPVNGTDLNALAAAMSRATSDVVRIAAEGIVAATKE